MAHYWGRFVPSVERGLPPGRWEHFRNAENPARTLKSRARNKFGRVHYAEQGARGIAPIEPFNDADQTAMMLIWLEREQPPADKAPDEVWHLTNQYGLIRSPWSVIIEPDIESDADIEGLIEDEVDTDLSSWDPKVDDLEERDGLHEPTWGDFNADEEPFLDPRSVMPERLWRPPTLDEIADRKVILVGDKRPLHAGAYVERNVERFSPTGIRQPCPECGVVPNAFTLDCRC